MSESSGLTTVNHNVLEALRIKSWQSQSHVTRKSARHPIWSRYVVGTQRSWKTVVLFRDKYRRKCSRMICVSVLGTNTVPLCQIN